jgi:hypothetical protein
MKSISQLTDFYYQSLYPDLQKLEKERLKILSRLRWYGGLGALIAILVVSKLGLQFGWLHQAVILPITVIFIVSLAVYKAITKTYTRNFKNTIITPLIRAIDPSLSYTPDAHIMQTSFDHAHLFPHTIDRYSGSDYVQGNIEAIPLDFSTVHAQYRTKDSKGNTQWHTLFHGIFLITAFPKLFHSKTIILPDQAEKLFGNLIGGWLQSHNTSRDDLIRMDDPEFEKMFVVYGKDPIEAHYLLTHTMMQRMVAFQKKMRYPLYFSFIDNRIYVAIKTNKEMFEPSVFTSLLKYQQVMDYIGMLRHTIGLVETLKLNEKLWSKT